VSKSYLSEEGAEGSLLYQGGKQGRITQKKMAPKGNSPETTPPLPRKEPES